MPTCTQITTVNLHVSTKKESVKPVHPDVLHAAPSTTKNDVNKIYKNAANWYEKKANPDRRASGPKKRVCETQTSASSHSDSPSTSQAFSFPNVTPTTEKSDTEMPRISREKPRSPDIWPDDIHNFVNLGSRLPESKKYDILFCHWKPESDYYFLPDENTGRCFQYECLTQFPWLAYSAAENGSFCINCVLFGGESTHIVSKLQRLMTSALCLSASDFQKLCQHSEKSNVQAMATLCHTIQNYD